MTIITGERWVPDYYVRTAPYASSLAGRRADQPDHYGEAAMQTAKQTASQPTTPNRHRGPAPGNALVPARVTSMPIEPPHPREVRQKLEFSSAASYKKAIQLADRFYWQAILAVDRREASVRKAERQAQVDQAETQSSYQRQLTAAQKRYRELIEQAHAKHRQAVFSARQQARQAEEVYKTVLQGVPGYGELQLRSLALADARAMTAALIQAYKGALGPDGLGDMMSFLTAFDRVLDLARDRRMLVPVQFAESLIKALVQRQLRHLASGGARVTDAKGDAERLKQAAGARLLAIKDFVSEQGTDGTPPAIRTIYFSVHDWLAKTPGTPFDLAMDRLKLDVEATTRREHRNLEDQMKVAIQACTRMGQIRPVAEAFQAAQRVLISSEQAAKNVLHGELQRIEVALQREVQMAEAMVVGMDHTSAKRLAQAKKDLAYARKMVNRWFRVLEDLQEIGRWQKLCWRVMEGFDHEGYWDDVRTKQLARQ